MLFNAGDDRTRQQLRISALLGKGDIISSNTATLADIYLTKEEEEGGGGEEIQYRGSTSGGLFSPRDWASPPGRHARAPGPLSAGRLSRIPYETLQDTSQSQRAILNIFL